MVSDTAGRILTHFQREIDSAFAELIHERWRPLEEAQWFPPADVYETEDAYLLLADLPGVSPDSVQLKVNHNRVVLCGSRNSQEMKTDGRHLVLERVVGRFCRTFFLERPIDSRRVETSLEEGVFRAILPKAKQSSTLEPDPDTREDRSG